MRKNFCFVILFCLIGISHSQVLSGASFLRTLPGARLQAKSGAATAGFDNLHAFYVNPGIAGYIREGQWSTSYTKWIADVYNVSFFYAGRVRSPWSPLSRYAVGIFYQGMDEFDSSDGAAPVAKADNVIVSGTVGQPLSFISNNVSIGVNLKYFKSTLADFDASAFVMDAGLFYKTPRFKMPLSGFGLFKYGILSSGVSVTNVGTELEYISLGTPLPRAVRGGVSLNTGIHDGLQTQFSVDYVKYRDEDAYINFGLELFWNRLIALNAGYRSMEYDLMDAATVGLSLNLDNIAIGFNPLVSEHKSALRLDLATQNEQEFFGRTYQGAISRYSIRPEGFRLVWPRQHAFYEFDSLTFEWEPTRDPDIYDDIHYHLLVSHDSAKVAQVLQEVQSGQIRSSSIDSEAAFVVNQPVYDNTYHLDTFDGGDYYWAVIAYDNDDHPRFAKTGNQTVAHFFVPLPDLIVQSITFDYHQWIDTTDYQGVLNIVVQNQGDTDAEAIEIAVHDSAISTSGTGSSSGFEPFTVSALKPGETDTLSLNWRCADHGLYRIRVNADPANKIQEWNDQNNSKTEQFFTVPKGIFEIASDTSLALLTARVVVELPFINEVNFDTCSSRIPFLYIHPQEPLEPVLGILAQRLIRHDSLRIRLVGYADPDTEQEFQIEDRDKEYKDSVIVQSNARAIAVNRGLEQKLGKKEIALPDPLFHLAYHRAQAVQDSLIGMGVSPEQIVIDTIKVWNPRSFTARATEADKRMVYEERRQVVISGGPAAENALFVPISKIDDEPVRDDILFDSDIQYAVAPKASEIDVRLKADTVKGEWQDTLSVPTDSLTGSVHWQIRFISLSELDRLIGPNISYDLTLEDTLGRQFSTRRDTLNLTKIFALRQHRVSFPLKFGQAQLLYSDYWNRIFTLGDSLFRHADSIRMRFEGHSCVIGSERYNQRLSEKRARRLKELYLEYVKNNHRDQYADILDHLDKSARGMGEADPLKIIRLRTDPIIIGDNQKPIGRKYNRRIEIVYYAPLIK